MLALMVQLRCPSTEGLKMLHPVTLPDPQHTPCLQMLRVCQLQTTCPTTNVLCSVCRRSLKNLLLGGNDAGPEGADVLCASLHTAANNRRAVLCMPQVSEELLNLDGNDAGPEDAAALP
jgi:hypothetical protein